LLPLGFASHIAHISACSKSGDVVSTGKNFVRWPGVSWVGMPQAAQQAMIDKTITLPLIKAVNAVPASMQLTPGRGVGTEGSKEGCWDSDGEPVKDLSSEEIEELRGLQELFSDLDPLLVSQSYLLNCGRDVKVCRLPPRC
jgi:hypothetical protein